MFLEFLSVFLQFSLSPILDLFITPSPPSPHLQTEFHSKKIYYLGTNQLWLLVSLCFGIANSFEFCCIAIVITCYCEGGNESLEGSKQPIEYVQKIPPLQFIRDWKWIIRKIIDSHSAAILIFLPSEMWILYRDKEEGGSVGWIDWGRKVENGHTRHLSVDEPLLFSKTPSRLVDLAQVEKSKFCAPSCTRFTWFSLPPLSFLSV